ncbi:DUF1778 domain-containing protein [Ralstonia pseudosolanacearum]|uniref:DUF1778 domain-containing protein n=1 Tax=Ralstonia pseudosolanacearum TaxID=1310165 RepID=UPI002004E7C1|nr:DUF1778 domain-containing protein [Ralstonia pseudosolanacearum]
MSPRTKELLRRAAESEHRTLSNMLEVLIFEYCDRNGIQNEDVPPSSGYVGGGVTAG